MPAIYLVRHGQTEWNSIGRFQGALNSPLTELGKQQASRVASILLREVKDASKVQLVSSPLGRAVETANIIAEALKLQAVMDARLTEISMGDWNGLTYSEIVSGWREALFDATDDDWHFRSPTGETYDDVMKRVSSWLRDLNQDMIAVAHGISGKLLRGAFAGFNQTDTLAQAEPQDAVYRLTNGTVQPLT